MALALAVASCAIDPRPFSGPSGRPAYSMECSGMGRTLHACFEAAGRVCPTGYQVISQTNTVVGAGGVIAPKQGLAIECR